MANAQGDALSFNADGAIDAGKLNMQNLNAYSLQAFGSGHGAGTLSKQNVGGAVVGPGTGAAPISGALIDFEFQHGPGGPGAKGSGGADLR
jgi:hypothetical protein